MSDLERGLHDARDVAAARDRGDAGAFARLVERYSAGLAALAYDRLGSVPDAQDAVQETFAQAYARLASLREPERFAGWIHEILRALCAMRIRRKGVERKYLARMAEETPTIGFATPLDRMISRERDEKLRKAVASLSTPLREAVALRYMSDMGRTEAAALLDIGQDAFDKRLERALRELRERMRD